MQVAISSSQITAQAFAAASTPRQTGTSEFEALTLKIAQSGNIITARAAETRDKPVDAAPNQGVDRFIRPGTNLDIRA